MAQQQQQQPQKKQQLKYKNYLQVPDNDNNNKKQQQQQQIQKKHSGPLDAALNELRRNEEEEEEEEEEEGEEVKASTSKKKGKQEIEVEAPQVKSTQRLKHTHTHTHIHGYGQRKRERWLLTRKTWKFMQDAGRKLLPDNVVGNRREDIPIIEANFQDICANEHKFLLWRRKVSFPGARRTSLRSRNRRLPCIRRHQQQQQQRNLSVEKTADETLELLAKYLHLDDHTTTTTALLSSKTQQPHQTVSPSAQRPLQSQQQQQTNAMFKNVPEEEEQAMELNKNYNMTQLLNNLQSLSTQLSELNLTITTTTNNYNHNNHHDYYLPKSDCITRALLDNKTQLRQIYNALKRQQLHRQLSRHSTPTILLRRTHSFQNLPLMERKQAPPSDLKLKSTTTTTTIPINYQQQQQQQKENITLSK